MLFRSPEPRGIFPCTTPGEPNDPEQLSTDFDQFTNYAGVEHDDHAASELARLEEKGFIRGFNSFHSVCEFLGSTPVLSKIGVITKIRGNKTKKRIVLDAKQSGVSAASSKLEHVVLPRATDVVWDMHDLLAESNTNLMTSSG